MHCPFQFLRRLGELFRLQGRRNPGSEKDLQNGAAAAELSEWRRFAEGGTSLQQDVDLDFAAKLLEANRLPVTNYGRLESLYPEAVASARSFVVKEVVSLLEFSRAVGRPSAFKYSSNLCFSFHELMTMLEIVLSDLSPDFRVKKDILRYTRKLALNNATFHNSVGGGMFHLYMKYRDEVGGAIFSGDKKLTHTLPPSRGTPFSRWSGMLANWLRCPNFHAMNGSISCNCSACPSRGKTWKTLKHRFTFWLTTSMGVNGWVVRI